VIGIAEREVRSRPYLGRGADRLAIAERGRIDAYPHAVLVSIGDDSRDIAPGRQVDGEHDRMAVARRRQDGDVVRYSRVAHVLARRPVRVIRGIGTRLAATAKAIVPAVSTGTTNRHDAGGTLAVMPATVVSSRSSGAAQKKYPS